MVKQLSASTFALFYWLIRFYSSWRFWLYITCWGNFWVLAPKMYDIFKYTVRTSVQATSTSTRSLKYLSLCTSYLLGTTSTRAELTKDKRIVGCGHLRPFPSLTYQEQEWEMFWSQPLLHRTLFVHRISFNKNQISILLKCLLMPLTPQTHIPN